VDKILMAELDTHPEQRGPSIDKVISFCSLIHDATLRQLGSKCAAED